MSNCIKHVFKTGEDKCFFCAEPKPKLNGKWPTNTFLQTRLAQLRMEQAKETLQNGMKVVRGGKE